MIRITAYIVCTGTGVKKQEAVDMLESNVSDYIEQDEGWEPFGSVSVAMTTDSDFENWYVFAQAMVMKQGFE